MASISGFARLALSSSTAAAANSTAQLDDPLQAESNSAITTQPTCVASRDRPASRRSGSGASRNTVVTEYSLQPLANTKRSSKFRSSRNPRLTAVLELALKNNHTFFPENCSGLEFTSSTTASTAGASSAHVMNATATPRMTVSHGATHCNTARSGALIAVMMHCRQQRHRVHEAAHEAVCQRVVRQQAQTLLQTHHNEGKCAREPRGRRQALAHCKDREHQEGRGLHVARAAAGRLQRQLRKHEDTACKKVAQKQPAGPVTFALQADVKKRRNGDHVSRPGRRHLPNANHRRRCEK